MTVFACILFLFLIVCAVAASLSKSLLNSILIFMTYSLVMSIIWVILESPDLAITEAAVGGGSDHCAVCADPEKDSCDYGGG